MLARDLDRLVKSRGWPCVSVLCSADAHEWDELVRTAAARVRDLVDDACADHVVTELERSRAAFDPGSWPSVGVFVNPTTSHAMALPEPVRPRVIVDTTFATRDIVAALTRSPRHLILTLDGSGASLHEGLGRRVVPARTPLFPIAFPDADDVNERRQRSERSRVRDAHIDRCHRMVDDAVTATLAARDDRPIFVIGKERRVHRFTTSSRHASRISAAVVGDPDATAAELAGLVAPHLRDEYETRAAEAVERVGAAIGSARFAAGVAEVWELARDGKVDLLVVEEDHHQSGTIDPLTDAFEPLPEAPPGGVDDAVDEIIEAVLAYGGTVEVTQRDRLREWGRIAARLRH